MAEAKYYNVKRKDIPSSMGIVIKVKNNKLENFFGDKGMVNEYGCSLDNEGNLNVSPNHFYTEIEKLQADDLKSDYNYYEGVRGMFDELPSSHLLSPGGELLA